MATQVNVGLNRRVLRSGQTSSSYRRWYKVQHKNVELVIDAEFGAEDFTRRVQNVIDLEHPGWSLTGYALPKPKA